MEGCEYECTYSLATCFGLTISYVGSLYVWKNAQDRDHPSTIKRRFLSAACMMVIAPFILDFFITEKSLKIATKWELMGVRTSGLLPAIFIPWLLTAVLFLGPLTMQFYSGIWRYYLEPSYWIQCFQDLAWIRNHVMAPASEEWIFRACLMPLLLQCVKPMHAVYLGPLFFGIAHFHHVVEQVGTGVPFGSALLVSTFQFMYTSLFGAYSAYLFITTGHFAAPLVAHMFCNHMGFPNFFEIPMYRPLQRAVIIFNCVIGACLWGFLFDTCTNPALYDNKIYNILNNE